MRQPPRGNPLDPTLYAELCAALATARDWNATTDDIELLRTAILSRETPDCLTPNDRSRIVRLVRHYQEQLHPKRTLPKVASVRRSAPLVHDVGELSFVTEAVDDNRQVSAEKAGSDPTSPERFEPNDNK
jgi:hypothetical protein